MTDQQFPLNSTSVHDRELIFPLPSYPHRPESPLTSASSKTRYKSWKEKKISSSCCKMSDQLKTLHNVITIVYFQSVSINMH